MTKIILASNSPQRKKLLKVLGVKFKVIPSRVDELTKITTSAENLVKENALLKASDVAGRLKSGIVIGADTLVYVGNNQIIGKPKNLKEAKKILKLLFSRPHWVYTGVALVDARTGRKIVDVEKTKIYMSGLSDEEIDRYHKLVSPLDKAGGFDIEGWGGTFISRIEGCYSNVVGLPMAKLSKMMKKIGVSLISLAMVFMISGCASEYNLATKQEESLMYGTDKEVAVGDSAARQIENHYKLVEDIEMNQRVNAILDRIVAVCDRKDLVFFIKIIDEDLVNAVSLPGGYVYVFRGLIDEVKNDDQLAAVIAHEVGHITAKHGIKRLQAMYGYTFLQLAASQTNAAVAKGANAAINTLFFAYSQEDEFQADKLGVKYMKLAGYNTDEMVGMLEILKKEGDKGPIRQHTYWRTHPHIPQRIGVVRQEITGELDFKSYLNQME